MKPPLYDESLFTIRFVGHKFDKRGVSIYDFGQTLVAFQRLINKTYLMSRGRLDKGAYPNAEERKFLALQVGARERKSDAFGLIPFLTDPATLQTAKFIGENLFSSLLGYHVQNVLEKLKGEEDDDKRFYIGSINAEVVNIVSRIEAAGGVEGIHIGAPALDVNETIELDAESKEYAYELQKETYLGKYQKVKGGLTKLLPNSKTVEIRRAGGSLVKVLCNSEVFEKVRYDKRPKAQLEFGGRAIYPLGATSTKVYEFQADSVDFIEDDSNDKK